MWFVKLVNFIIFIFNPKLNNTLIIYYFCFTIYKKSQNAFLQKQKKERESQDVFSLKKYQNAFDLNLGKLHFDFCLYLNQKGV